jgi:hypothetical protein
VNTLATVDAQRFVIGYHASVAGQITRLLVGGLGMFTGLSTLVPHPANWWVAGLAVAGAVIFYAGIHRLVLCNRSPGNPGWARSSSWPHSACSASTGCRLACALAWTSTSGYRW